MNNYPVQDFSLKRVIFKGALLFLLLNFLFAPLSPLPAIGKISAYNHIFPGRVRLPYGENPDQAYNLSLYNLEAMFSAHELSALPKPPDEYRIILIGDSSVWGYLLKPEDTLSAQINTSQLHTLDGRLVRAYNLGFPTLSLAKDLLVLKYAMQYQPDLIIWLLTLESFPVARQLDSPIVQNNKSNLLDLITRYKLKLNPDDPRLVTPRFLSSTLIGERRELADLFRLQIYGVMWAATGIDQFYPKTYEPPQSNLTQDITFHDLKPPHLDPASLSFDILSAGKQMAGNIPVLYINEPIYISQGENSDIRYNFFYPKWAYDQYRQLLSNTCRNNQWEYLDEWSLVSSTEFTNSAIHMSPSGTKLLAPEIEREILHVITP